MSTRATPDDTAKPPLALIAGPTASGKSDLAVDLALALRARGRDAVVINADSAQAYADLRVLSARPDEAAMRGVRHRLFGAWGGGDACSAADWAKRAAGEIAEAHAADAVPILVGGSGLYLRTLLDGIAPVPPIEPEVRTAVRALPTSEAFAALRVEDPQRAAVLSPGDAARIARALEVVRSTGRSLTVWQAKRAGGIVESVTLHPAILLPPREWLYPRCEARFAAMLEGGAVEEVEALLARHLDPSLPVMRAIGLREIAAYLRGEATLEQTRERGAQSTRNYAKRQYTWFRRQSPASWPRTGSASIEDLFASLLRH